MKDEGLIGRQVLPVRQVRLAQSIFVIADDLTGAAEMAGIASSFGLSVSLLTVLPEGERMTNESDVVVVATDMRSSEEHEAVDITRKVVHALPGDVLLFKKTDSALRGHIMAEMRTIMEATGKQKALFIPANPSKGRVICQGIYYVNSVPISQTSFSSDPEFPAVTSSLSERFPEAEDMGVMMPDVSNESDIRKCLEQVDSCTLLAGAADLFSALLFHLGAIQQNDKSDFHFPTEEVLVVCGSTQSRPEILPMRKAYMPLSLYNGEVGAECWMEEVLAQYAAHHALALCIAFHHLTGKEVAVRLRETMAAVVKCLVKRYQPKQLVVEGGATAFACCRALGLSHFQDICQLAPGVVRILADNGMYVTLKPGSYLFG